MRFQNNIRVWKIVTNQTVVRPLLNILILRDTASDCAQWPGCSPRSLAAEVPKLPENAVLPWSLAPFPHLDYCVLTKFDFLITPTPHLNAVREFVLSSLILRGGSYSTICSDDGFVLFTGLGCEIILLMASRVYLVSLSYQRTGGT